MATDMDVQSVRSRDIALVGYDRETGTLEIAFRGGGVYHYREVPASIYEGLMSAPSHGTYFQKYIRKDYSYTKIR